jgi:hypothetical protein
MIKLVWILAGWMRSPYRLAGYNRAGLAFSYLDAIELTLTEALALQSDMLGDSHGGSHGGVHCRETKGVDFPTVKKTNFAQRRQRQTRCLLPRALTLLEVERTTVQMWRVG